MRTLRRILAALAVVCMFVPCISMVSHAASAELRFTDPSTTVGAEVEVTAKFTAPVLMDSLEATLTYDSSKLRFVSGDSATGRSEEHTSELQSRFDLVCRLLLVKKKII